MFDFSCILLFIADQRTAPMERNFTRHWKEFYALWGGIWRASHRSQQKIRRHTFTRYVILLFRETLHVTNRCTCFTASACLIIQIRPSDSNYAVWSRICSLIPHCEPDCPLRSGRHGGLDYVLCSGPYTVILGPVIRATTNDQDFVPVN
jgi:hypothetical protein